jgi:integrase
MVDITRKRERDRLAIRREPYWHRLGKGKALGFRRGPDTWIVRLTSNDSERNKTYEALDEQLLDFDQAKTKAEAWLQQVTGVPFREVTRGSVRAALETYLVELRRHDREGAAQDAAWRFKKYVYSDKLADISLERATRDDFEEWRERQRPGRQNRTVNRQVRSVVAGLNRAVELGHVGNPLAWKLKELQDDTEDSNDTAVFLTPAQRAAFIAAADPSTGHFLRAIELTGARPHEIAKAVVSDFDGSSIKLAHRKGRPPKLRVRYTTLGADGVEFFAKMADGKEHNAPLFKPARLEADNDWDSDESDGRIWYTHLWGRRVRAAIEKHNEMVTAEVVKRDGMVTAKVEKIPEDASAYSFRHSRISELLQIYNIDPLTVAQQTGTSVAIIEKTYFKFIPSAMRAKLAAIKDSAGRNTDSTR